jgi:hypothetical protein
MFVEKTTVACDKICGLMSKPILIVYDKYVAPKVLILQSKIDDK